MSGTVDLAGHFEWLDWLRNYEVGDPEPEMKRTARNRYTHYKKNDEIAAMGGEMAYQDLDNAAHILWHRRMTNAWKGCHVSAKIS